MEGSFNRLRPPSSSWGVSTCELGLIEPSTGCVHRLAPCLGVAIPLASVSLCERCLRRTASKRRGRNAGHCSPSESEESEPKPAGGKQLDFARVIPT
ncbi:hypothetical protein M407DRAFT_245147 [Tulasnella calospora MUT 4182]|uniref:Uncharacterized protein n=1 Tax=Tulasnella calospora MUT 4182 TaxID=1051891 RepID=A0A0C3QCW6_9AGAM|nr:hypothetical protein M407DRAFT_245147 [Tulasnella calospora MUT 4182]